MKNDQISWWLILLINLNVMIGAGIFVYPSMIASYGKSLGFLSFALVFLIMIPLVFTVAQISLLFPAQEGGLYVYSKQSFGKKIGLFSAVIYFVAKAISCSIMIRTFVNYLITISPTVAHIPGWFMRLLVLLVLVVLNFFGIKQGARLQLGFSFLKIGTIIIVIIGGFLIFNKANLSLLPASFGLLTLSLPLAMYPMMGFETCCAIAHTIAQPRKMAQVILYSFFIVTGLYMFFQFFLFGALGSSLIGTKAPLSLFFETLFKGYAGQLLTILGVSAVMTSALGAAYGILFTNSWYAYVIGKESGLPSQERTNGIPIYAVLFQGILIAVLVVLPIQLALLGVLAVFGVLISYLFTALSMIYLYTKKEKEIALPRWVALLSVASCIIMMFLCLKNIF